jgi:hypothetical protein
MMMGSGGNAFAAVVPTAPVGTTAEESAVSTPQATCSLTAKINNSTGQQLTLDRTDDQDTHAPDSIPPGATVTFTKKSNNVNGVYLGVSYKTADGAEFQLSANCPFVGPNREYHSVSGPNAEHYSVTGSISGGWEPTAEFSLYRR